MTSGFDIQSLMQGMGEQMPPEMGESPSQATGPIQLLTDALKLVRQATDTEQDPQLSVQLEQISTLLQKAIATDHADRLGSLGMKPGMMRTLSKAV